VTKTTETFSNRGTRRKCALFTLLLYVACGLTLTAHIALANHHCSHHCHDVPDGSIATTTLSASDNCTFDHHEVEEHHEAAVTPGTSAKYVSPVETQPNTAADRIDPHASAAEVPNTPTPRTGHDPATPARAPPASLPV